MILIALILNLKKISNLIFIYFKILFLYALFYLLKKINNRKYLYNTLYILISLLLNKSNINNLINILIKKKKKFNNFKL